MCGIAGSFRESMFEVLMEANSTRGNFSQGILQLKHKRGHATTKKRGGINFDTIKYVQDLKYLIGHCQAPTSSKRTWGYDTSHPFQSGDWTVVHNGVLTNDIELRKMIEGGNDNPVDTSSIAMLLNQNSKKFSTMKPAERVEVISETLGVLRGTFALAMVYLPKRAVYIARQGSILHYDSKGNFSTIKGDTFNEVNEGDIMHLVKKTWTTVGKFKSTSPFVMI